MLPGQIGPALRLDREAAGDQAVQDDAEAVDVRRGGGGTIAQDVLRSHEQRSARGLVGADGPGPVAGALGDAAEIHQDDAAALLPHDVGRLDVAVDETGGVHGRQGPAEVEADQGGFVGAERTLLGEGLLERLAAQKVGPEADAPCVPVGPVDDQDVGVPDARQAAGLLDEAPGLRVSGAALEPPELERDLALQRGIDGAVNVAEAAAAERPEDLQGAPGRRRPGLHRDPGRRCGRRRSRSGQEAEGAFARRAIDQCLLRGGDRRTVCAGNLLDETQVVDLAALLRARGPLGLPVHRRAVGDRLGHPQQRGVVILVHPSPPRAGRGRAPRTCGPRWPTGCRGPRRPAGA